jgi:hypothetical protein
MSRVRSIRPEDTSPIEKKCFFTTLVMHSDIRVATEEENPIFQILSSDAIKENAAEAFHYAARVLDEWEQQEKRPMKVIFLDVDGVLNSRVSWNQSDVIPVKNAPQNKGARLDPLLVGRLRTILEATGAKIVVHSTWRDGLMEQLVDYLERHGIPESEIIGRTPLMGWRKQVEILAWLSAHPQVTKWLVLDDAQVLPHEHHNLLLTTWDMGLQPGHVVRAIETLGSAASQ